MLYTFLLAIVGVGISMLLLGIRVFFTRKGNFPNFHIEANKYLQKKGITCAKHWDKAEQERVRKERK